MPPTTHLLSSGAKPCQKLGTQRRISIHIHMLIGTLLPPTLIPHEVQTMRHLLRPRLVIVRTAGPPTAALSQVAGAEGAQRGVVYVRTLGALVAATAAQAAEEAARLATEPERAAQNGQAAGFGPAGGRGRRGDW